MAEIVRNSVNLAVAFPITGAQLTGVKFYRSGDEYIVTPSGNNAPIPYDITHYDGKFDVEWTYTVNGQSYTQVDTHEVYTPFFTKSDLVTWDADFNLLTDEAVYRLEVIIRTVIQNITGQKFGLEKGHLSFQGSGGDVVSLSRRVAKADRLNDVTGNLLVGWVGLTNDGWALRARRGNTWLENLEAGQVYPNAPITDPFTRRSFREGITYVLEGEFGYYSIPSDILLAAKILAEDYGCDESLWRDRYIDNIRAADWRFEFSPKAYLGTGNVKVDQILQKYTLNRMVVL